MDLPEDVTDDEWLEQTLRRWEVTLELAHQRLADADMAMVRAYTQQVPPSRGLDGSIGQLTETEV